MRYQAQREWWLDAKLNLVSDTDPAKAYLYAKPGQWVDGLSENARKLKERESQSIEAPLPTPVKRKKK